jgi:hypothetical protein
MLDEDRGSTPFYRAWARPVRARALSSSSRQPTTRASATSSLNARSDLARSADARSVETRSIYARSTDGRSADARSLYARSIEGRSDAASDAVSSEAAPQNMFDGGGGSGGGGDGGGGSGRGGGSERRSAHDHINVGRARRVTSASVSFADGTRGGGESEDLDDDDDDDGDDNPGGRGGARSTLLGGGGGHCRGDHGGGGGGDKNRGRSRFYQHDVRRGASPGEVNNNGNGGRGTSRSVRSGGSGRGILVGIGRGGSVGRIVPGGSDDSEAGSIDVIGYSSNEDPVARLCGGRREQSERLADTPVTVGTGDGDMDALCVGPVFFFFFFFFFFFENSWMFVVGFSNSRLYRQRNRGLSWLELNIYFVTILCAGTRSEVSAGEVGFGQRHRPCGEPMRSVGPTRWLRRSRLRPLCGSAFSIRSKSTMMSANRCPNSLHHPSSARTRIV